MTLPFTRDAFFAVFATCNTATWPAELVAYAAGAVMLALALAGRAPRLVAALLALMWAWTGIVYHAICFAPLNPPARAFAIGFVIQAALLAWHGAWRGRLAFAVPLASARGIAGLALVAYAAILYPLIGRALGHAWPAMPAFGLTPCPLVIFTFGLFMLARGTMPAVLLAIPVLWALVGGTATVLLDMPQDIALPVAALAILWWRRADPAWQERRPPPAMPSPGATP